MKAASSLDSRSCGTSSEPASIATTSCPSRPSASCACAPERSDTLRSSELPPLSTATRFTQSRSSILSLAGRSAIRRSLPSSARQLDDVCHSRRRRLVRRLLGRRLADILRGGARTGGGGGGSHQHADQPGLPAHRPADPPDALADVLVG